MNNSIKAFLLTSVAFFNVYCSKKTDKNDNKENIIKNYIHENKQFKNEELSKEYYDLKLLSKSIATDFLKTYTKLVNKYKIETDLFPILIENDERKLTLISTEQFITMDINIDADEDLNSFLKLLSVIQTNIKNLNKYFIYYSDYEFKQKVKSSDFRSIYIINQIINEFKNANNSNLNKYLFAHFLAGFSLIDFEAVDKKNLIIQLGKNLTIIPDELETFSKNFESFLEKNLLNIEFINFDFNDFYSERIEKRTNANFSQFFYDQSKKFSNIKNSFFNNKKTISSSIDSMLDDIKDIDVYYEPINSHSVNTIESVKTNSEKLINFYNSYQEFGKNNSYQKFIEFSYANFSYNNLVHLRPTVISGEKKYPVQHAPIKKIDLTDSSKIKINFGDYYVYETENWEEYGGVFYSLPRLTDSPAISNNKEKTFSLLSAFNFESTKELSYNNSKPILLPTMPEAYVEYSYAAVPGIHHANSPSLEKLRNIQRSNKFKFIYEFFNWKFYQHVVNDFDIRFIPTDIDITLSSTKNILVVPKIPYDLADKIQYKFKGNGGDYYLKISNYAEYQFEANSKDKWFIDATDILGETTYFGNTIFIGNKLLHFVPGSKPKEIIIKQKNGVYKVFDENIGKNLIPSYDFSKQNISNPENFLNEILHKNDQKVSFVEIENYLTRNNKAWFDTKNSIFINPLNPNRINKNDLIIIGKNKSGIFLYNPLIRDLYYISESTNTLELIEANILNFKFDKDKLYFITDSEVVLCINDNNIIKIFSFNESKIKFDDLKEIAKNKKYRINENVLTFSAENKLLGWYLSQSGTFFAKE
nr:hypothetical protein GTC16762_28260 [Pigmentibacter ruber]